MVHKQNKEVKIHRKTYGKVKYLHLLLQSMTDSTSLTVDCLTILPMQRKCGRDLGEQNKALDKLYDLCSSVRSIGKDSLLQVQTGCLVFSEAYRSYLLNSNEKADFIF